MLIGGNGPRHPAARGPLRRRLDAQRPGHLERIPELQRLAEGAGRGPIPVTMCIAPLEDLGRYRDAGIERAVLALPSLPRDDALRELDRLTAAAGVHT